MSTEVQKIVNDGNQNLEKILKKRQIFDPRILDDNDSSKQLWSSDSVELANKGLIEGYKLKDNPYLKSVRGALLRKSNLAYKYTQDELKCIEYCSEDKIFFANNFAKLKDGNNGWVNITLRDYQENLLEQYTKNRWNILLFPRQSGKTTTTIIEIVHFLCFNVDKDAVVIAQSEKVVNEILGKIKECFQGLPFFMQPGFISFNKKGCTLDNGCRLSIGVASESVVQGFSLDLVFIDEFAYIRNSLAKNFWSNIYPTLVNNKQSRCIIASTPNGRNLFHTLWSNAVNKTNKFTPYRIYWYDVPGRDEQFKQETIENVGIDGWLMGFECSFDVGLKSIFSTPKQQELRLLQTENENNWSYDNHILGHKFDIKFISQDIIKYNLKQDYFLLSIDLAEGLEQDSTVLKIKKIDWSIQNQRLEYTTIGVFHDNTIAIEDFAVMNLQLFKYFTNDKIKVVVENNTYGAEYFLQIDNEILHNPYNYKYYSPDVFAVFKRDSKNSYERGIRWNAYNKKTAVKSFANLVTKNQLVESYSQSIEEYLNFGKIGNSYSASYGHDDLVMSDVTAASFIKSNDLFTTQWLRESETQLRYLWDDEPIEIKQAKAEAKRKADAVYKRDGWIKRNHKESLEAKQPKTDETLILML